MHTSKIIWPEQTGLEGFIKKIIIKDKNVKGQRKGGGSGMFGGEYNQNMFYKTQNKRTNTKYKNKIIIK